MDIYRGVISKDINIDHISNVELSSIFDDMGRKIIYEYLLFGKDFTYEDFVEIFEAYLKVLEKAHEKIENF